MIIGGNPLTTTHFMIRYSLLLSNRYAIRLRIAKPFWKIGYQKSIAKSLVIPQVGEEANEKYNR